MLLSTAASAAPELNVGRSTHVFKVDGQQVDLDAYNINGNNYVKLRDVAGLVDFGVEYNHSERSVTIDPNAVYTPETTQTPKEYNDVPYKTVSLEETDPNYYKELWAAEVYNYKMIKDYPTLYVASVWDDYLTAANTLAAMNPDALTEANIATLKGAKAAREIMNKNQIKPFSDGLNGEVIYIRDEGNMPTTTENVEQGFNIDSWDNSDFKPFIIPYLVADQSKAKGNLIVLSGGGNETRSNAIEGYMVSPAFVKQGYNCFLLQRRVEPYNNDDIVMDLQRAIRYVRYYGENVWNLGAMDILAATGFSGGAGNICTLLEKYYGNITPDTMDKNYQCDAIDAVNSDLDVALPIYSGRKLDTENPNMPHIFTAVGEDDGLGGQVPGQGIWELYVQMKTDERYAETVNPEIHIYGENGHGFGSGLYGTSSMLWIPSADMYIQKVMGKAEPQYTGEIPAKYTLKQTVTVTWLPIGDTDVTVYVTPDHASCFIAFYAWADNIQIEATLVNDHVASVTYDNKGYFGEDAAKIYDLCDQGAWLPV